MRAFFGQVLGSALGTKRSTQNKGLQIFEKEGGAFQVSDKGPNFGTQAGTKNRKTNSNQTQPKSAKHSQLALEGCPKN